ncbi:hypothetical protein JOL79_12395 [Microbispora sp. RL4-1S]|uniref:Uncharacterized protein n=1 Tax=Microbispora oryzae TaxID=2806554 RepID=A0A940WFD4_9ACTN|nr:hypothetical protein [Microbispora oryzae]MBP2704614.1 hypothetical protein [Microbispora oryzae]
MRIESYDDLEQRRRLERDFPGWGVWRAVGPSGEPGGWYASRRRRITPAEVRAGLWATVDAASPERLAQLLAEQTELASRVGR